MMKNKRTALGALLLVGLSGCVILNSFGPREQYAFGHRLHIEEEDLECLDCHLYAEDDEDPGYPKLKQCNLCHKEIDQELGDEFKVKVFYEEGRYLLTNPHGFDDEVVFSHLAHVEAYEEDCTICHVGIDENEQPNRLEPYKMAECVQCHQDEGRQDDCDACHQQVNTDWTPPGHDLAWERMHGVVARSGSCAAETANDCALCHTEQNCDTCHNEVQPANHGTYFKKRGHGLMAQVDRGACVTCHAPDYCDRCHQETEPISHTGMFGGTKSNHCVGCHLPIQGESCYTCHKDTPSHFLATPLPLDHNPGMNCRQCHGTDQPLPHVDKGDACTNCHM